MKRIIKIILMLVIIYAIFVTVDCIRLKLSMEFTKPIIVIESESTKDKMTIKGLGYKVVYKIERIRQTEDLELLDATEGKFVLFDTFTLWTKKYDNE